MTKNCDASAPRIYSTSQVKVIKSYKYVTDPKSYVYCSNLRYTMLHPSSAHAPNETRHWKRRISQAISWFGSNHLQGWEGEEGGCDPPIRATDQQEGWMLNEADRLTKHQQKLNTFIVVLGLLWSMMHSLVARQLWLGSDVLAEPTIL